MQIKLNDYINEEHGRLDRFQAYWASKHIENPENFPINLSRGEWWEHTELFDDEKYDSNKEK